MSLWGLCVVCFFSNRSKITFVNLSAVFEIKVCFCYSSNAFRLFECLEFLFCGCKFEQPTVKNGPLECRLSHRVETVNSFLIHSIVNRLVTGVGVGGLCVQMQGLAHNDYMW